MGNQEGRQQFQTDFTVWRPPYHPLFREHTILTRKNTIQRVLHKEYTMPKEDAEMLRKERAEQKELAFSLVTPKNIFIANANPFDCNPTVEVNIYFEWIGQTLEEHVKKRGPLSNSTAMFMLSELTRGLWEMEERGRAHWSIAPNTVFVNSYENHYIYDTLYIFGRDPRDFMRQRVKAGSRHQCPLSAQMYHLVSQDKPYGLQEGLREDMYSLGMTMLYALTGKNVKTSAKGFGEREKMLQQQLKACQKKYSQELVEYVKCMLDSNPRKRITNRQLLTILNPLRQSRIIQDESREYSLKQSQASNGNLLRYSLVGPGLNVSTAKVPDKKVEKPEEEVKVQEEHDEFKKRAQEQLKISRSLKFFAGPSPSQAISKTTQAANPAEESKEVGYVGKSISMIAQPTIRVDKSDYFWDPKPSTEDDSESS